MLVLAFVQHFLISKVLILHTAPDIPALFIAFISMSVGQRTGTTFGFATGLVSGLLTGNPGFGGLVGSTQGLLSGLFHVPEESHATSVKKKRMFYAASATSAITGYVFRSVMTDPLSMPLYFRLPEALILGTLMSMVPAVLVYHAGLKKLLRD